MYAYTPALTHKLYIKSFGLYSVCEWAAGVYTYIFPKKTVLNPIRDTRPGDSQVYIAVSIKQTAI
jgi:hypothetical protein